MRNSCIVFILSLFLTSCKVFCADIKPGYEVEGRDDISTLPEFSNTEVTVSATTPSIESDLELMHYYLSLRLCVNVFPFQIRSLVTEQYRNRLVTDALEVDNSSDIIPEDTNEHDLRIDLENSELNGLDFDLDLKLLIGFEVRRREYDSNCCIS